MLFALISCSFSILSIAQENFKDNQINLFFDCQSCDLTYIRQELPQLNYARRLENTDVLIRSTKIENASVGYRHNLFFIGHNRFQNHDQELFFIQNQDMSFEETRQGILNTVKAGLVPYIMHISPMEDISITFPDSIYSTPWNTTKWKNWTALVGGNINFNSSNNGSSRWDLDPRISILKETPEEQFGLQYNFSFDKNTSSGGAESSSNSHQMFAYYAKAIGPRWSLGGNISGRIWESNNLTNKILFVSPMIEYSICPYQVFHKKRLTIGYSTTINQDIKFSSHGPRIRLSLFQKWGFISAIYSVHHNLIPNTTDTISTQFSGSIWFRLSKGFYLSLDAILLGNLQLQSNIDSFTSTRFGVSFNYVLGDIYNNVVNPRLGF